MLLLVQLDASAGIPLKLTLLVPWVAPNPLPLIATAVPIGPDEGDTPEITGGTVNVTGLEACPCTVTTIGPVVAFAGTGTTMLVLLHEVGVA